VNILYVLGSYYPAQQGGPNNTVHWQAKYLSQEGVNITVASLKTGLTEGSIINYNIRLNVENNIEGVSSIYFDYILNRYFSFRMYFWLVFNIKRFDFVQLTSYFFPLTWFAAIICRIYNVKFSIAPRGELEPNALKYKNNTKKIINAVFLKYLYRKACFILVTSEQEFNFCKFYFPSMKFEIVPNYIDMNGISLLGQREISKKSGVLYLGRLHPKKGIENLIAAYTLLPPKFIDKNPLLIVGSGSPKYENELKSIAMNSDYAYNIKFLGHKQGVEKNIIYKKSKVLVLPSYSENFGNVVLESLCFSTPVISSKYTPWKSLQDGGCGFWIDNTSYEIKNKLEIVLRASSVKYTSLAENSYRFVEKNYSIDRNIGTVKRMYIKYIQN